MTRKYVLSAMALMACAMMMSSCQPKNEPELQSGPEVVRTEIAGKGYFHLGTTVVDGLSMIEEDYETIVTVATRIRSTFYSDSTFDVVDEGSWMNMQMNEFGTVYADTIYYNADSTQFTSNAEFAFANSEEVYPATVKAVLNEKHRPSTLSAIVQYGDKKLTFSFFDEENGAVVNSTTDQNDSKTTEWQGIIVNPGEGVSVRNAFRTMSNNELTINK